MKIYQSFRSAVIIALVFILAMSCTSNWPQFRGPENNMVPLVKNLPQVWGDGQNIKWEYPLEGNGWCSPIVWGDKIFITEVTLDENSYTPDTTKARPGRRPEYPQDGHYRWMVYCLDKNSGELIWEQMALEGKPRIETHRDNTYASETPATDGKMLYVYFGMHGLFCYDLEGNLVWERDFGSYLTTGDWGVSTSPVVYKNILYMQIDSDEKSVLYALDKKTGEEIWNVPREEKTNYSTPVIWKNKTRTELVTMGLKARSYDPGTGKLIWELDLGGGRNISSPVYDKKTIYLGMEKRRDGGGTLFAVKAGSEGDITPSEGDSTSSGVLWSVPNSGLSMPTPVLYKGYIYITDRRPGAMHCYEASTGRIIYQKTRITDAGPFWASPWAYDDKIFCPDERGTTHVIKAGEEFEILSTNSIDDKFWSSAAMIDNALILRGVSKLYYVE